MKLAIIGGGSSYTPELIGGLLGRTDVLPLTEVWLMDRNPERLEIVAGLARRMSEHHGASLIIHHTTDLQSAVRGAAFVVTQLRVGGMHVRIRDEKLGLRHGLIGQETTGVGGFACALRTIPAILEIAQAIKTNAPNATLLNFTNPSGIVTEALFRHSPVRSVGLCNIPIGYRYEIAERFSCAPDDVSLDYMGLNHLSWIRGVRIEGADRTTDVLRDYIERADEEWDTPAVAGIMRAAMQSLGMVCNGYLQYYYAVEASLERLRKRPQTRGEEVLGIEERLFARYQDPELVEKPEELSKRGGALYSTAALAVLEAIARDEDNCQIVCCRNAGALPGFDSDACIEVPALIGRNGAVALPQPAPPPEIRGLMQAVKAYETLTVDAAVRGDREKAFQAVLAHPLMPDASGAKALLDELLEENRSFLKGTFF